MHLYLALFLHRDYFDRPDASLSCSFVPQGLFRPGQMHLYLAFLLHRDYFDRPDASLSCFFAPQGLFRPVGCISILLFCSTGIISTGRMHLYLALLLHRDYFARSDASLSYSFVPQGLLRPVRYVPHRWKHLCQSIPSTAGFWINTVCIYIFHRKLNFNTNKGPGALINPWSFVFLSYAFGQHSAHL